MPVLHRVLATGANLRDAPGSSSEVIVALPFNHIVRILAAEEAPGWSKVVTQFGLAELTGYVASDLLAPVQEAPAVTSDLKVTAAKLKRLSPNARSTVIDPLDKKADAILSEYAINRNAKRLTQFFAQLAHESGGFRVVEENLNYSAERLRQVWRARFPNDAIAKKYARNPEKLANYVYANRIGNGPESSGDGWRFRGRGLIQLTGRANYKQFGDVVGIDLIGNPDIAADPVTALKLAAGFWDAQQLNKLADNNRITRITERINGGRHGLEDRRAYLVKARAIWGKD